MLEVVIPNTNDKFHYQLSKRFSKALELNILFLQNSAFFKKVNFTIVDWGSKKKFSDVFKLNKKILDKIYFINVPKKVANKFSKNSINFFHASISSNIGFRRTKKKFILQIAHDQIIPTFCWNNLFNFLEILDKEKIKNPVIYIPRFEIEKDYLLKNPNFKTLNNYTMNASFNYKKTSDFKINLGAGCSVIATSKQIKKLHGFTEISDYANDLDLHLKLSNDGSNFYDGRNIGVYSLKFPTLKNSQRLELIKKNRNFFYHNKINKRNTDWGLAKYKLKKIRASGSFDKIENSFSFLNDKYETINNDFEKKISNSGIGYLKKDTNLKLIIFYYIFKYSHCVNFLHFSKSNYDFCINLQNYVRYINTYFCYDYDYFKKKIFSYSLQENLRNIGKLSTGKFQLTNIKFLSKIFQLKQNNFFAVYIDDLFHKNIMKFQKYYMFIIIEKKNKSKLKFQDFKNFFEIGTIIVLINKKYEKKFINKGLFLSAMNTEIKKNFKYRILIILKRIFKFVKNMSIKLLALIKKQVIKVLF